MTVLPPRTRTGFPAAPSTQAGPADLEIPLGRRSRLYRAFEILPGVVSIAAIVLVFVVPFISPRAGAVYVLCVVGVMFLRAIRGSVDLARGYGQIGRAHV